MIKEYIEKINGILFEILMGTILFFAIAMGLKAIWLLYTMGVYFR